MIYKVSLLLSGLALLGAATATNAQGVLDGVVGGPGDDAVVTIGSGEASDSGTVNVGVGGGGGNVLDVNLGSGPDPVGNANVSSSLTGSGDNLVDAHVGLFGDNATVDAEIGRDTNLNVSLGGDGNDRAGGNGNNGSAGSGNSPGRMATGGNDVGNRATGLGSGRGGSATSRVGSGPGGVGAAGCSGPSTRQVAQMIRSTRISASWSRAANVQVTRVALCPEVKKWLDAQLRQSGMGSKLTRAIRSDELLSLSVRRSNHEADDVFAVKSSGRHLTVYVY